jgi:hypothetical protein
VIKSLKPQGKVNAPGHALCCMGFGICSTDIKIKTVPGGGFSAGGAVSSSSTLTSSSFSIHNHTYMNAHVML